MSGQGSSGTATQPLSYENALLDAWGAWVRTSKLGTGYASLKLTDTPVGTVHTESEILLADRAIAGMPRFYKKVVKRFFWFQETDVEERHINTALSIFSEHLNNLEEC